MLTMQRSKGRCRDFKARKAWRWIAEEEWERLGQSIAWGRFEPATKDNYDTGVQAYFYFCNRYNILDKTPTKEKIQRFYDPTGALGIPARDGGRIPDGNRCMDELASDCVLSLSQAHTGGIMVATVLKVIIGT